MTFRPSVHGWPFGDEFSAISPSILGLGALPSAPLALGGGLCWAALDRYLAGIIVPRRPVPPEPGSPLYEELMRRSTAALAGVWPRVRIWQRAASGSWRDRLPVPVLPGGDDLGSRTRREWRRIRGRLKAQRPVLLTLLAEADGYARSRAARQVLALGFSRQGMRVTVAVYDPGRPDDDDVRLGFSLAGPLAATLGDEPVRGFFAVAYDRAPAATVRVESFDERNVIGLNRKISGRTAAASVRRRLDLVARSSEGALLHFHRPAGSHWEGTNVTGQGEFGTHEMHSDPAVVRSLGALDVFARSYVGDLLHFRFRRRWTFANRTEHRRAGPRFRIAGAPVAVAGPRGRLTVLGRDRDGGLIHYRRAPLRGWTAEQVAGEPLAADPVARWIDRSLHVIGVAADGRVLHWERTHDDRWIPLDLSAAADAGATVRLDGPPAVISSHGELHVFGRDRGGDLVHLARDARRHWRAASLAYGAVGTPAPCTGPAGLHVFARAEGGGILHAWTAGTAWRHEDILATRPGLDLPDGVGDPLFAWGDGNELWLATAPSDDVTLLHWRPDADWIAAPLRARAGTRSQHRLRESLLLHFDGAGTPHLFATDGRGTLVHLEPGPWREPAAAEASTSESAAPTAAERADADRAANPSASDAADIADADQAADVGAVGADKAADAADAGDAADAVPREEARSSGTAREADFSPAVVVGEDGTDSGQQAEEPLIERFEPMDLSLLENWPQIPQRHGPHRDRSGQPDRESDSGGEETGAA